MSGKCYGPFKGVRIVNVVLIDNRRNDPWLCIKPKKPTKDGAAGDLLAPFIMLQKVGGSKA